MYEFVSAAAKSILSSSRFPLHDGVSAHIEQIARVFFIWQSQESRLPFHLSYHVLSRSIWTRLECSLMRRTKAHFPNLRLSGGTRPFKPFIPRTGRKTGHSGIMKQAILLFAQKDQRCKKFKATIPVASKQRLQQHAPLPSVRCNVGDQSLEPQSKELLFVVKWRRPRHHPTLHSQRTGHKELQATAHGNTWEHRHRGERERKKRLPRRDQDKDRECLQRATKVHEALNKSITVSRLPPSLPSSSPPPPAPPCSLARSLACFDTQIPSPPLATHNQSPLSTRPTINQSIKKPTQSHNSVINQSGLCGRPLLRVGRRIYR